MPRLKLLALSPRVCAEHRDIIPSLLIKWKNLEGLKLGDLTFVDQILEPIPIHLPKFASLDLRNCSVSGEAAAAIVSHVPKLKHLSMTQSIVKKEYVILIMQGCKQLEILDVRSCIGFEEDDEDILRLSSGIKYFQCHGSKAIDDELYEQIKLLSVAMAEVLLMTDIDVDASDSDDEYETDQDEDRL